MHAISYISCERRYCHSSQIPQIVRLDLVAREVQLVAICI